jgi:dihydropteroate synthase
MATIYRWQIRGGMLTLGQRPLVMGIVNATPDSFSDGGQFFAADRAVEHALALVAQGADLLDIGGESTRPGAEPVPLDEEIRRVIPVIERLARQVVVPLSVDTYKAEVARRALVAGAAIINDVTGLQGDAEMHAVARETGAGVIVMHMQGTPTTMQVDPRYDDVVLDIRRFFEERLSTLGGLGIGADHVVLDPGIGFGKRLEHNLSLLARLPAFLPLGRPICLGVSRKGFINRVLGLEGKVEPGVGGTIGVLLHAYSRRCVQIARVHNVADVHAAFTLFRRLEAT